MLVNHSSRLPMEEDRKRVKFRELAEKRTNKALEAIRLIGNLSNRQNYTYEDHEARKVLKALRDAVAEIEAKFSKPSGRPGGEFKL
jgi:ABC-type Fe3+-hydroxamate transport system substrate-binding protein